VQTKIDVQGSELEVLKGADKLLRYVPKIVVEIHSRLLAEEVAKALSKYFTKIETKITHAEGYGCVYAWR
jgi:hypothetical protein